ncbi:carboxypeptidase-like regulatory domain-containing protein, partial [Candidatus Hydrogenedentota bacterium]
REMPQEETPRAERKARTASVSGQVTGSDGYPLEGATVYIETATDSTGLQVSDTYTVETDAEGMYEIKDIVVAKSGMAFASAEGYVMARNYMLKLSPGMARENLNFRLRDARYFVAGRVVSKEGTPIPGAAVQILYYGYTEKGLYEVTAVRGGTTGSVSSTKIVFALTDEHGYFELAIPQKGLCDLTVTKNGYGAEFRPFQSMARCRTVWRRTP